MPLFDSGTRTFLARLSAYERLEPSARSRGPEKLAGVRRIADDLGRPERAYRIVHVAGTNGKGMTATMIARLIGRAGFRCGLYTSPHVVGLRERIAFTGPEVGVDVSERGGGDWGIVSPIAPQAFARAGTRVLDLVDPLASEVHFGYFDLLTLIALEAFREAGVAWAVLETGLGGRSDATNITPKELCVLTRIGWDHMHVLGEDLHAIASEKLGIVPPGTPTVLGGQPPELAGWLEDRLRERDAPIHRGAEFTPVPSEDGRSVAWKLPAGSREGGDENIRARIDWGPGLPPLNGPRLESAGMALNAVEVILGAQEGKAHGEMAAGEAGEGEAQPRETRTSDFPASGRAMRLLTALETTLPGRLERRLGQKVPAAIGGSGQEWAQVVLDGGHNPDALTALCEELARWRIDRYGLLLTLQRDKLVAALAHPLRALLSGAVRVMVLEPQTVRAPGVEELTAFLHPLLPRDGQAALEVYPDARAALRGAGARCGEPLVVAGSLWTVGDVCRVLDGGTT